MTNKRKLKRVRNSQSKAIKASDKRQKRKLIFDKAVKLVNKYDPAVLFIGGVIGGMTMTYNRSRIGYARTSALLTAFSNNHKKGHIRFQFVDIGWVRFGRWCIF